MTSGTTKTAHLSEEDMLDRLANDVLRGDINNIGVGGDANDNGNNNDDENRTIMSNGGDTSVIHVAATTSASPSSVVSPLDKSIVSPPLLSESVDQSLTNDLASAMAHALNMPTAREITEVLQDLYILPDYRMANDDECYSDADDYSTSSSEYEYARRQQSKPVHVDRLPRPFIRPKQKRKARAILKSLVVAAVSSGATKARKVPGLLEEMLRVESRAARIRQVERKPIRAHRSARTMGIS